MYMRRVILVPVLLLATVLLTNTPVSAEAQPAVPSLYARVLLDAATDAATAAASGGIADTNGVAQESTSMSSARPNTGPESGEESASLGDSAVAVPEPPPEPSKPRQPQPVPDDPRDHAAPVPAPTTASARDTVPISVALNIDGRWPEVARGSGGVVTDRQIIAYYGNPNSRYMGILGENDIDTMAAQLKARAAEYDAINGDIGVAPAFHIIYGTVFEDANVGILARRKVTEYINFAAENDILVFLDHQLGKYDVDDAIRSMLPFLQYENVHLAIDPEWSTPIPGREIGQVDAFEVNEAQRLMSEYIRRNDLPGNKMLVVHQFNWRMITNRERVRSDYDRVELIHHADGFGNPDDKRASWQYNVLAENIPLKGFKLFYPKSWRRGGYDVPLMTPAEVMQLEPVPVYIQYQ
jgi:hypothetical protein